MRRKIMIFIFLFPFLFSSSAFGNPVRQLFNCYFEEDFKYSTEHSKAEIDAWKQEKLLTILKEGFGLGVFEHNEGGPHGAHWNSNANLFCVALFPNGTRDIQKKKLFLNGRKVIAEFETQATSVTWSIPGRLWVKSLRQPTPLDCPLLLSTDLHPPSCEDMIAAGKVVTIQMEVMISPHQTLKESHILHRATGE